MKRFVILTVALLIGAGLYAQNITSDGDGTAGTDSPPGHGPGNVYTPTQQPNSWYIVDLGGNGGFDMSAHGGPTSATPGTSGAYIKGVEPHAAKARGTDGGFHTLNGMITMFFDPFEDGPGPEIEWWIPGSQDKQPPVIWIHDTATGVWFGEDCGPNSATGQIGTGFNEDYFYYDVALLGQAVGTTFGPIDAICLGGGFGTSNHPATLGPNTSDFDGDGTIDPEVWLGGAGDTGRILAANADGFDIGVGTNIPEPITMLLVGGGLLALIRRK